MKKTMFKGLKVEVEKIGDAGIIHLHKIAMASSKLVYEISVGQPYKNAIEEAEILAIIIDAELVIDNEIKRYSSSGEYSS